MKHSSRTTDGEPIFPSPVLREVAVLPGLGETISVRAAKTHLSALLNLVEDGREITITSGGKPKARLSAVANLAKRIPFTGTREHLATMPKWDGGPTADEIIRADRDGRGW
jgi:prevent-host-death family protein